MSHWFPWVDVSRVPALRLLCLPYAGGAAVAYRTWSRWLPPEVEVWPVELPGRGTRMSEPLEPRIAALVARLADALGAVPPSPFALFGHSMGALLAYELTRELERRGADLPAHLFVSGAAGPPAWNRDGAPFHDEPDDALIERVRRWGGTPPAVLDDADVMRLMLPILRNDLALCATYEHRAEPPLGVDISVFGGSDDRMVPVELLETWRAVTTGRVTVKVLRGGHFFLHTAPVALFASLRPQLVTVLGA